MALIKCSECGKEVSDKAAACIHCGYPFALERQDAAKKNNFNINFDFIKNITNKITSKNKTFILISGVAILVLIIGIVLGAIKIAEVREEKAYQIMIEESRNNIAPYLEIIPCRPDEETGKVLLPGELYKNIDNVEFLGLKGSISFPKDEYGVIDTVYWASNDFFTYDEHQEFVSKLDDYFGTKAVMDYDIIGQWTEKDYYWEDESVPSVVVFYTSVRANHEQETDRFEVYWDMDAEMPD